jgi:lysophospholipase L1-like esterase
VESVAKGLSRFIKGVIAWSPPARQALAALPLVVCGVACGAGDRDGRAPSASVSARLGEESSGVLAEPASSAPPVASAVPSTIASAAGPPARRRYAVAAIGDSLTDPKSHGGKYLETLQRLCPKSSFVSFGKGGNMVNMMRKRFVRDLYSPREDGTTPSYTDVIILGGLGDILSNETAGRTAQKVGEDILLMVGEAKARGARVLVLQLPPWGTHSAFDTARAKMTHDVSTMIASWVEDKRIDGTLATRPLLQCGNVEVLCKEYGWKDGIHWSAAGHEVVGKALHELHFGDCE